MMKNKILKKLFTIVLLFAILPFANAELCNSESDLSVSYSYNQSTQNLTLIFDNASDVNAFLIIANNDLESVI